MILIFVFHSIALAITGTVLPAVREITGIKQSLIQYHIILESNRKFAIRLLNLTILYPELSFLLRYTTSLSMLILQDFCKI